MSTISHYDATLIGAREKFIEECSLDQCSWRVLRIESIIDCLYKIISKIEILDDKQAFGDIKTEFLGIINYGVIGLIQIHKKSESTTKSDIATYEALTLYDHQMKNTRESIFGLKALTQNKELKDFDLSVWILSIKTTVGNIRELTRMSNKMESAIKHRLMEIINYSIFALEKIE